MVSSWSSQRECTLRYTLPWLHADLDEMAEAFAPITIVGE